jgi:prophage regulatory protein
MTRAQQPMEAVTVPDALLRIQTVTALTGLSVSTIYRLVAAGTFPQPRRLGARCTRWRAGDVTAWLAAQGVAQAA